MIQEHEESPMCLQKKQRLRDPRVHVRENTDFLLPYKKVQQFKDFPSVKNKNLKKILILKNNLKKYTQLLAFA